MILSSIYVCIGQLFWKLSVGGLWLYVFIGFCLYGLGALLMIAAYKFGSLSVLQPILSLNYIFAVFLGYLVLGESLTMRKCIGILIITASVIVIGSSKE
jgi:undecaprenyl phosphate-alpha-L-ara4N flippase subunit ArnE